MGKKVIKKLHRDAIGLTTAGIGMGVGAAAVTSAGGSATPIANLAGKMPMMGSIAGAGATLGALKSLSPKKGKRKKY